MVGAGVLITRQPLVSPPFLRCFNAFSGELTMSDLFHSPFAETAFQMVGCYWARQGHRPDSSTGSARQSVRPGLLVIGTVGGRENDDCPADCSGRCRSVPYSGSRRIRLDHFGTQGA